MPIERDASNGPVVVLAGPTASGKTALAIQLAEAIGGEIISADSMQVYRGMDIGTAKPSTLEQEHTAFHLIDVVDPDAAYTASDWKRSAERAIRDISMRGLVPILCGGTGMYMRALLRNWSMADTPRDTAVRAALDAEAAAIGTAELHARLAKLDPTTAARLHPNDRLRIVRALEVCIVSGTPISKLHQRDLEERNSANQLSAVQFALEMPREQLYRRIDERVDHMIEAGFELEVRGLIEKGYTPDIPAMGSLGYREVCYWITGNITRDEAIDQMKQNTRRYAKRQITWFRAEPEITWVDTSTLTSAEVLRKIADALVQGPNRLKD